MKILITGGAGFVGANLAVWLAERGHRVLCLDNLVRRGSELNLPRLRAAGAQFQHGDVRCTEDLPADRYDVVLHTAAQTSVCPGDWNPVFDLRNNTEGLWNILEYCRQQGAGLIFWSTNKVYGGDRVNNLAREEREARWVWSEQPTRRGFHWQYGISAEFDIDGGDHSVYGLSKVCADLACQEYAQAFGIPVIVNRCSCLYGPGQWGKAEQGWVTWFAAAHHFGLPVQVIGWGGKQVRDLLFIDDLCRLVEAQIDCLASPLAQRIFNVGGGPYKTLSVQEAILGCQHISGRWVPVAPVKSTRRGDHCIYVSDIRDLKTILDWAPRMDPIPGLERTYRWVRDNAEMIAPLYGV